jgi:hypothetical protein
MNKIFFTLIGSILFLNFAEAQQKSIPVFINKDSSFSNYISQHLNLDSLKLCEQSSFFIRFKINRKGDIYNLAFSKGITVDIKRDLQNIIFSSNGKWKPCKVNNKKIISQYLILWVYISVGSGCNQQLVDDYFNARDSIMLDPLKVVYGSDSLKTKEQSLKKSHNHTLKDYLNEKSAMSMKNLLEFDDDKNMKLWNCIILGKLNFIQVF